MDCLGCGAIEKNVMAVFIDALRYFLVRRKYECGRASQSFVTFLRRFAFSQ